MKKIIALLLAVCMIAAFAGCAKSDTAATTEATTTEAPTETTEEVTAPVEAEGDVMSHADYMAAELDSPVCIETYVQAHQSWWDNKLTVYAQSEDGAYFIYNMECSEEDAAKLVPGTKIRVNGYKTEWSGEVEIIDATCELLEGTKVYDALDVTSLLGSDELIQHQNEKVAFKGMTVAASNDAGAPFLYNWDGSGSEGDDLYFNVSLNDKIYTFVVESYLCGPGTDVYEAVKALNVGDVVDMEGFLYWYEGVNPHITSVVKAAA